MPRRRVVAKREILPDPKFRKSNAGEIYEPRDDQRKKSVAERIVYGAPGHRGRKLKKDPVQVFEEALENVALWWKLNPAVGGATYQVPVEVRPFSSYRPGHALVGGILPQPR